MARAALTREVAKLKAQVQRQTQATSPVLDQIRRDPSRIMTLARMEADSWQTNLLCSSSKRVLILGSRQVGKSLTGGVMAVGEALSRPHSLVLLLSPSLRQSSELFKDKVLRLYNSLGRPLATESESALRLELGNGSRI